MKNMKTKITLVMATAFLVVAAANSHAEIIAGPITNPANGHDYFLLTSDTWSGSEAAAEQLVARLPSFRIRPNKIGHFPSSAISAARTGACGWDFIGKGRAAPSGR